MAKNHFETANCSNYELLKDFSKKNRHNQTEAESVMWKMLRRNALGCKFRRQHIIMDYIADFICISHNIIIEIDGEYHNADSQVNKDAKRTEMLESEGFKVLRFTNNEVICNTDNVLKTIKNALANNK